MLKITDDPILNKITRIDFDKHIPVNIHFGNKRGSLILKYSITNNTVNSGTVIKLKISKEDNSLFNINLTSIDHRRVQYTNLSREYKAEKNLLPQVDTNKYDEITQQNPNDRSTLFQTEEANISFEIGKNYLDIIFDGEEQNFDYIESEKVRFGIDSNRKLRIIQIMNLSNDEIQSIKNTYKHLEKSNNKDNEEKSFFNKLLGN